MEVLDFARERLSPAVHGHLERTADLPHPGVAEPAQTLDKQSDRNALD